VKVTGVAPIPRHQLRRPGGNFSEREVSVLRSLPPDVAAEMLQAPGGAERRHLPGRPSASAAAQRADVILRRARRNPRSSTPSAGQRPRRNQHAVSSCRPASKNSRIPRRSSSYPAESAPVPVASVSVITKSGGHSVARRHLRVIFAESWNKRLLRLAAQRDGIVIAFSSQVAAKHRTQFGGSVGARDYQGQGLFAQFLRGLPLTAGRTSSIGPTRRRWLARGRLWPALRPVFLAPVGDSPRRLDQRDFASAQRTSRSSCELLQRPRRISD